MAQESTGKLKGNGGKIEIMIKCVTNRKDISISFIVNAEENYDIETVLNAEISNRLLEMGLIPNKLKKHKRQLKEKLIQKQNCKASPTERRLKTHGMSQ